ncbi:MAG: ribonuclease T [Candidatus Symbiodolus clandestinus]
MDRSNHLANRFRGYFPVVIDIETAGFNAKTDAILELAAVILHMDDDGWLKPDSTIHCHVEPFSGANLDPNALAFNRIDPYHPLRNAISESVALQQLFNSVKQAMKVAGCQRSVVVAHNAAFDHSFLAAATERTGITHSPFHPFVTFDTTALSGLIFGQTVLAKACYAATILFDPNQAHSALYDAQQTALLFCELVNRWKKLGGWPPALPTKV